MAGSGSALWRVDEGAMPGCPVGSVVWFENDGPSALVMKQGQGRVGTITSPDTTQTAAEDGATITLVNASEGWQASLTRLSGVAIPPTSGGKPELAHWEVASTGIPARSDPRYAGLEAEIRAGARLVVYTWAVSVLVLSFRRPSEIKLVKPGQSAVLLGMPYTLTSLVLGWWGIPWGPLFTIQAISRNLRGGRDVTRLIFPDVTPVLVPSSDSGATRSSGLPPGHR